MSKPICDNENLLLLPIKIGSKAVPNRIAVNSIECNDADGDGNPTQATYDRYEKFFSGQAAFIDFESITVQNDYVSRDRQLSIMPHNAKPLEKFIRHLKDINSNNILVLQLTHSGEISSADFSKRCRVTEQPIYGYENAELIGEHEVEKIIQQFVEAAKIAYAAGADGVDLKFCHGYFGSQILRPFNSQKWKYGGPWENRRQFVFDLIDRVAKAVNDPGFIIGSKLSMYEGFPGGQGTAGPDSSVMDLTESIDLIKGMEERGVAYILQTAGCSHARALSQPVREIPDYAYLHHYFQKVCKDNLRPETVVIGSGYSIYRDGTGTNFLGVAPEKNSLKFWGNKNIRDGVVDMVCLGRQSIADAFVTQKMAEGCEDEINWCTACGNCGKLLRLQENVGCPVYDPNYAKRMKEIR